MRNLATTRFGTASLPDERVRLHWQLSIGQPHFGQIRPPLVE
jgi:hypothetical protein